MRISAVLKFVTLVAGLAGASPPDEPSTARSQAVAADRPVTSAPGANSEQVVLRGKVSGPDGRPIAGARLYVIADAWADPVERGVSFDGSYRLSLPREKFRRNFGGGDSYPPVQASLIVLAEGLGPGWVDLGDPVRRKHGKAMESEYVRDVQLPADLPIVGRVVDQGGEAVAGAVVMVKEIRTVADGDWGPVFAAIKADKIGREPFFPRHNPGLWSLPLNGSSWTLIPSVTTDAGGRFRITGVGRDRAVVLGVNGPGVRSENVIVLTRDDVAELTRAKRDELALKRKRSSGIPDAAFYGPSPTIAMQDARTVAGIVRDARDGAPIPGVKVAIFLGGNMGGFPIDTDAQGRYRITRQDNQPDIWVGAKPGRSDRYLAAARWLTSAGDTGETVGDFSLERGVEVSGLVVESGTKQPILSALHRNGTVEPETLAGQVDYYPLSTNAALRDTPTGTYFEGPPKGDPSRLTANIDGDGRFRLAVPSGPGVLLVRADAGLSAVLWGIRGRSPSKEHEGPQRLFPYAHLKARARDDGAAGGDESTLPGLMGPISIKSYHAYRVIDPPAGAATLKVDLSVPRAPTRLLRFVGPDGCPARGVTVTGLVGIPSSATIFEGSEAEAVGLEPGKPREIAARADGGELGVATSIGVEDASPATIRLEPTGTITGRLIDDETGGPLVRYSVSCVDQLGIRFHAWTTDAEGRFTVPGVVAGLPASISFAPPNNAGFGSKYPRHDPAVLQNLKLRAGKTRDVGDVRIKPAWR